MCAIRSPGVLERNAQIPVRRRDFDLSSGRDLCRIAQFFPANFLRATRKIFDEPWSVLREWQFR